jgi:hypothetical protein
MALLSSACSVGSTPFLISFKYNPFRGAIILTVTAIYGGAGCEIRAINYATVG